MYRQTAQSGPGTACPLGIRGTKKAPTLRCGAFAGIPAAGWWPSGGDERAKGLLGSGCATSGSSGCGIGSGLGGVAGRSRSFGGRGHHGASGSRCVGSGSFCRSRHRSRCGSRCFDGSRCRRGRFFLLAASGESDGRDQGSQNERVLHFGFFLLDRRILKFAATPPSFSDARWPLVVRPMALLTSTANYREIASILTNTDRRQCHITDRGSWPGRPARCGAAAIRPAPRAPAAGARARCPPRPCSAVDRAAAAPSGPTTARWAAPAGP